MEFDYQFFKDIVLIIIPVVIPVIIGAFTASKVTENWQIKNEKSRIKRQILNEFSESEKKSWHIMHTFYLKVLETYTQEKIIDDSYKRSQPLFENRSSPKEFFNESYKNVKIDLINTNYASSVFLSSLRLYYRDSDLEPEYQKLRMFMNKLLNAFEVFVRSTDELEFKENNNKYRSIFKITQEQIRKFEVNLIDTPLHELTI